MTDKHAVQIPLPLQRYHHHELEQFHPGNNRHVVDHLAGPVTGGEDTFTFLWGEHGTGKSHLLQAMCTRSGGAGRRTAYLPLGQHEGFKPEMLEGLEQLDLICIDDLEVIAGIDAWEQALFYLFNRIRENRRSLIISAAMSPTGIPLTLPDLKSRLQSGVIFHLQPLSEADRIAALKQRAGVHGIELADEVTTYIVRRVPRDMHTLFVLLDRLDQASLEAKRKITVPFVKEIFDSEV